MLDLLKYPGTIVDANYIVYFCFRFTEKDVDERRVL